MHWTGWIVVILAIIVGGFMAFDGARAFIVGDYITPSKGEYAGRLGPWAGVVQTIGINPRSTLMKLIFVVYGLAYISLSIAFVLGLSWAWWGLLIWAVLGLWYLPFGTIANVIVLILLLLPPLRLGT